MSQPSGWPRHYFCLPLGAITNLLEGSPSLVRLDIDGDLEPILFESLRAYTEQGRILGAKFQF
jgi:hypothetical protein